MVTLKGVAALNEALKAEKGRGGIELSNNITRIIEDQMLGMGDVLCQDLKRSLRNVLAFSDVRDGNDQPSREDKLMHC
jgi:hypothetical protein